MNRKRHWIRRLILLLMPLIIVIAIMKVLSAPSHGHMTHSGGTIKTEHAQEPKVAPASSNTNTYFDLDLPLGFTAYPPATPAAGSLFSQTLQNAAAGGTQLVSIGIDALTHAGLQATSGYTAITKQPERYTKLTQVIDGDTVEIYSDAQAASVVAFWTHGDKTATIGVASATQSVGDPTNQAQQDTLKPVLKGWRWN